MRTWLSVFLLIFTAVGAATARQAPDKLVGIWSGTWEGAGSGGFEITLEAGKDGTLTGKVAVTGDPTYNADFATLAFDGPKMTATYDFPPDNNILVKLAGTFDAAKASGTWAAVMKSGEEVAAGTWTVAKK